MKGEHFSPDTADFIELLGTHVVRYLLVGGEAVIYYGYPRLTGDVDFWFEQSRENTERLFTALSEFWGGRVPGVGAASELMEPGVIVQFGRPPNRIDLIASFTGIEFNEAWVDKVEDVLDLGGGRRPPLYVIALDHLLRNKRAIARHKDLDDVEHLEALRHTIKR